MGVGTRGFQHLCLACRRGLEDGEEDLYLPALELLETLLGVFSELARGQLEHLASVFQAAQVGVCIVVSFASGRPVTAAAEATRRTVPSLVAGAPAPSL